METLGPSQREDDDHAAAAAIALVRGLGVCVSDAAVRRRLAAHPNPTSLLAIAATLQGFGVDARGIRAAWEHLPLLPLPLIAHLRRGHEETYLVVRKTGPHGLTGTDPGRGEVEVSREEFEQTASGAVVVAVPGEGAPRVPTLRYRLEQAASWTADRRPWTTVGAVVLCVATVAAAAWFQDPIPATAAWQAAALVGLAAAGLLSDLTLGDGGTRWTGLLAHACDGTTTSGCGAAVSSPHARLFGRVPYAFLGVGAYAAALAAGASGALVPGLRAACGWVAAAIFAGSLVLATRLVFVQARVLSRWCALCMTCHAATLVAFLASAGRLVEIGALPSTREAAVALLIAGAGFATPVLALLLRSSTQDADQAAEALSRIASDPRAVRAAFEAFVPDPGLAPERDPARFDEGPDVVVFADPFCPHCAEMDQRMRDAAKRAGRGTVSVQLFAPDLPVERPDFLSSGRSVRRAEMSAILYAIEAAHGTEAYQASLERVLREPAQFAEKTPWQALKALSPGWDSVEGALDGAWAHLRRDAVVARRLGVARTPSVFVDGRPVPPWASADARVRLVADLLAADAIETGASVPVERGRDGFVTSP